MSQTDKTSFDFFASANSFSGFFSLFDEVFRSQEFESIYVLKGGPGTGKSFLLKRICRFAEEKKIFFERFYCSSDPKSLDGVILHTGNGKIAILDGTAPHERDAVIPGAVDSIINLGESWNKDLLKSKRNEIESLCEKKKMAYKNAYDELSICLLFAGKYEAEIKSNFDFATAERDSESILNAFNYNLEGYETRRFVSSFSKNGYQNLSTFSLSEKPLSIVGDYGTACYFGKILVDKIRTKGYSFYALLSPLLPDFYEGIYFSDTEKLVKFSKGGEQIYDASKLLKNKDESYIKRLSYLENSIKNHMSLASEYLKLASDYHFSLEAIYTPTMDFNRLDEIGNKLIDEIKNTINSAT